MEDLDHNVIEEKSKLFKVLSNNVRLCILTNLCKNGEKRVSDLQECALASQSFVSQQLIKLKDMGIITDRKDGVEVYYRVTDEKVKDILKKIVLEDKEWER